MIKRFLVIGLMFSVATSILGAQPPFVLGAEDAAGPWGQADGTGCGNDIVLEAFAAAGYPVKLETLPYARAKAMTLLGKLDGCFAMSYEPDLAEQIVLAETPLYTVTAVLVRRLSVAAPLRSLSDLPAQAVVGIVRDYEYPTAFTDLQKHGLKFESGSSEVQNLRKLAAGRLDFVVLMLDELKSFDYLIKSAQVEGQVEQFLTAGKQGSYVGFGRHSASGLAAKRAFDRGYDLIRQNGQAERILLLWKKRLKLD